MLSLSKYVQYQRPQVLMLHALVLPLLGSIYNFGWRSALVVLVAVFTCWFVEYLFTKQELKPATTSSLVTGALLGLIVPPNVPFWQIIVGSMFCMVFAKMVFGGFGRNIFNPAIVGRCFLYICFPATFAATWYAPFTNKYAGLIHYTPDHINAKTASVESSIENFDGITSATTLTTVKKLNEYAKLALLENKVDDYNKFTKISENISIYKLILGNINGSVGETCKWLILLAFIYLVINNVIFLQLFWGPIFGVVFGKIVLHFSGFEVLPFLQSVLLSIFGGGTLFACCFMVTEPVTAPVNNYAKWIYGFIIGLLATLIRSMSVFNAGFMFAIIIGNALSPTLDIIFEEISKNKNLKLTNTTNNA